MWGGADHEHEWVETPWKWDPGGRGEAARLSSTLVDSAIERQHAGSNSKRGMGAFCSRCPGWRGELGSEPSVDLFIAHLVSVFDAVRRVLHPTGTLLVELGDSYSGSGKGPTTAASTLNAPGAKRITVTGAETRQGFHDIKTPSDLPAKNLLLVPFRFALAMQADGWILRSVMPWVRRNAMPESCVDRPSSAVSYVFLFAQSRSYYWDGLAVRHGNPRDRSPRIVQGPDLDGQRVIGRQDFGAHDGAAVGAHTPARVAQARTFFERAIGVGAALLQFAERECQFSLAALDPEMRQQLAQDPSSPSVGGVPVVHRAAVLAALLLDADISPKQFMQHLDRLGIALTDGDVLRIDGRDIPFLGPRSLQVNGNAAIRVDDAGEIGQDGWFDLVHNQHGTVATGTCIESSRSMRNSDPFFSTADIPDGWQGLLQSEAGDPLALVVNPQPLSDKRISKGHVGGGTEHFASFPGRLVEPLIRAGSSEAGCCAACRAPYVRVVEKMQRGGWHDHQNDDVIGQRQVGNDFKGDNFYANYRPAQTTGWRPSCDHGLPPVPATVLDPFGGSGTTAVVAQRLGRDSVLLELNPDYVRLAKRRLWGPLFADAEATA